MDDVLGERGEFPSARAATEQELQGDLDNVIFPDGYRVELVEL
jgi:hypothetical protein